MESTGEPDTQQADISNVTGKKGCIGRYAGRLKTDGTVQRQD